MVDEFEAIDAVLTKMEILCGTINSIANIQRSAASDGHVLSNRDGTVHAVYSNTSPKIELPKFYGNIIHWRSFHDMFLRLVHNNSSITNIERFH